MKNKIFLVSILSFFISFSLVADEYNFEVSKIKISQKGNVINAYNGEVIYKNQDLKIFAEEFVYLKDKDSLSAFNGEVFLKKENTKIKFKKIKIINKEIIEASNGIIIKDIKNSLDIEGEQIIIDRINNILTASDGVKIKDSKNKLEINAKKIILNRNNNVLTASDGIKIYDLNNSLRVESETIVIDRLGNIIESPSKSILIDKYKNVFQTSKFQYNFKKEEVNIFNALISDFNENNFEIDKANIDLKSYSLKGKNILVNLNNGFLSPDNEPRLKGESIVYSGNITKISNGIFTACKKTDTCPPWELSASEITHDRKKKNISYKNVWLNIYDVPVMYFPKFFHPDPTVKRQSGLLMPTFKNTPNKNTFFSVPYFKVLSENKDLTFTPRFYAKDQLLVQNEYREINENSKIETDFSMFKDKEGFDSHLFIKSNKKFDTEIFNNVSVDFKVEQISSDTYLKANQLNSPLINSYEVLENSLKFEMYSDTTTIDTEFIIYENLNRESSDKYEYILPKIKLSKDLNNNTDLNGDFKFDTDNYVQNYNTNVYERVNTNNLRFNSVPKIYNNGFKNNYEFIIKNTNTNSKKTRTNKEGKDFYLSGLFQLNSGYPLIKNNDNRKSLFTPKIALKLSPGHSKDLSKYNYRLDANNLFNLERISSNETLEGGASIAYGIDYLLTDKIKNRELFGLKIANNLRIDKNEDLERNNQLHEKTSNFFGQIVYNPFDFLNMTYDFSTLNNFSDSNYQNLVTEIKFNKFTNKSDYLNQDGNFSSYFLNKTTYKIDTSNSISFSTRENLKTDLTEYYNLVYQYKNDCLAASVEYQKDYYKDRDITPSESIFLKLTIIPFGSTSSPNLKQ